MKKNTVSKKDIPFFKKMEYLKVIALLIILNSQFSIFNLSAQLATYPAPQGATLNSDFSVKVRIPGKEWQETPTYLINVDEVRDTKHNVENASLAYFDFSSEVEVAITFNRGTVNSAQIRPLSYKITPKIDGNTLIFSLKEPRNLSVEINGDIFHNLHLFAGSPLVIDSKAKNPRNGGKFMYFPAGIHKPENGGSFRIHSGTTVYVAGGALLMGQLLVENARDVKIIGRGMVDRTVKEGIRIANSKNVYIEGLTCTQCPIGGSDSVVVKNVKSISYYGWGDGMNIFASSNVLYDSVFCRNSDDCHTVYATRKGFTGSCRNITMRNSTLWADVAHPIQIGTHGSTEKPDVIENCRYENIDILDHNEKQIDYQGCMSLNAGDSNFISDISFENIRVENFRCGQLLNIRVFYNSKYCTSPGRGVENIHFKNITYNGTNAELSIIAGYDEQRKVKNITFENLNINGQVISDDMEGKPAWYRTADMARIFVGEHVENLTFTK
ncbi:MAG: endo-polygalacturonase [Dysgonamonadaceae bacterium]|jgi:hypothetical protein|nr:endo-polygalacturonase [Dysgonamonadaceae bacterium]